MADTCFVIVAAGQQTRWNNHLGCSKHMAIVHGEPLIHRTQRQLLATKPQSVTVLTFNPDYANGAVAIAPEWDSILPNTGIGISAMSWSDKSRTVVIFGDVFFTDFAISLICGGHYAGAEDVCWYGRNSGGGNDYPWKELFAISFYPEAQPNLRRHIERVRLERDRLGKSNEGGWLVYRSLRGLSLASTYPVASGNFVEIGDETTDFDTPEHYDKFIAEHGA